MKLGPPLPPKMPKGFYTSVEQKMSEARNQLVMRYPFWSFITLGLTMTPEPGLGTMATDGKRLFFDPHYVDGLTLEETLGVIAHESGHSGLLHPFRMKNYHNKAKCNMAMDMVVNLILRKDGIVLPGRPVSFEQMFAGECGYLHDTKWDGMSWEEVYAKMPEPPSGKGGGGKEKGKGGKSLQPSDIRENDSVEDETEAKVRVEQAAVIAKQRGKLPAGIGELIEGLLEVKVDWKDVVRAKVRSRSRDDYDARRHNRRLVQNDIYYPGLHSERVGEMVIAIDTSGSTMGDRQKFFTEMVAIAEELRPTKLTVVFCDAAVAAVNEYSPGEYDLLRSSKVEFKGGGGTSFVPVFEWVAKELREPELLVYFTDMWGDFPSQAPPYDVIWLSTSDEKEAPFGEVISYPKQD